MPSVFSVQPLAQSALPEATADFTFTVIRSGDVGPLVEIKYTVVGSGSAPAEKDDFFNTPYGLGDYNLLRFGSGQTSATIHINARNDLVRESDEEFTLMLDPAGAGTLSVGSATGVILNDDTGESFLSIEPLGLQAEGNSGARNFTFTVRRSGNLAGVSGASYAVTGSGASPASAADFGGGVFPIGTVSFSANVGIQSISIPVAGDMVFEPDETFTVTLLNPSGGAVLATPSANATILNDDPDPTVSVATISGPGSKFEGSSGVTNFDFIVTRTGPVTGTASIGYRTTNVDTTAADFAGGVAPSGTVTFAPGETSKTISIGVAGDMVVEGDERFTVTLTDATPGLTIGPPSNATATILNDEAAGPTTISVSGGGTKTEGESLTFTVSRSGNVSGSSTVAYSVRVPGISPASPEDFVGGVLPSGTLSFAPGDTTRIVTIATVADGVAELGESFQFLLGSASGATVGTSLVTGFILDGVAGPPTSPPGVQEATSTLNTAFSNILKTTPGSADAAMVVGLAAQLVAGSVTRDQALASILDKADATTSVATMAYEFFTGKIPSAGGMDYLVSPAGPNPNNLNSPYYQNFSIENRNINFAVNLGKNGDGQAKFAAEYGALDLFAATTKAYQTIFGTAPTPEKVHALIDSRADYFAYYGQDGANGIGTKAAMVGWLLAEAEKANIGTYARSNAAFLMDLADGASYAVDIVGVYGKPEFAI